MAAVACREGEARGRVHCVGEGGILGSSQLEAAGGAGEVGGPRAEVGL